MGIYNLANNELITYAAMALPFEVTNESKRQNTMEFIAVVLGLLLAWRASLHVRPANRVRKINQVKFHRNI